MKLWEGLAMTAIALATGVGVYMLSRRYLFDSGKAAATGPDTPGAKMLGAQPGAPVAGQPRQAGIQPLPQTGVTPAGQVPKPAGNAPTGAATPKLQGTDPLAAAASLANAAIPGLVQLAKDPGIQAGVAGLLKDDPKVDDGSVSYDAGRDRTVELANQIAKGSAYNPVNGTSLEAQPLASFGKIGNSPLADVVPALDNFAGKSPAFDPNSVAAFTAQAEAQDIATIANRMALTAGGYSADAAGE